MSVHAPVQTTTILAEWLQLLDKQGVTARNRDAHRMGVERLGEYLKPRSIDDATTTDLRGFLAYLGELGVSEQSRNVYRQILQKWILFAQEERKRQEHASAAAAALAAPPERPLKALNVAPVIHDADNEAEDATVVFETGAPATTPATAASVPASLPASADSPFGDEPLSESQAESTWPFAKRRRPGTPSMNGLAAQFDGVSSAATAEPPVVPVTIDFADAAAPVIAPAAVDAQHPGAAPQPAFTVFSEPEATRVPAASGVSTGAEALESAIFGSLGLQSPGMPSGTPASLPSQESEASQACASALGPQPSWFDEPKKADSPFAMPASSAPPAFAEPEASFGTPETSLATPESSFGTPESAFGTPAASFGSEGMSFGTPETLFGSPETETSFGSAETSFASGGSAAADDDATPAKPFAAMTGGAAAMARASKPVLDSAGDHVMGDGVASIPLGGGRAHETVASGKAAARAAAAQEAVAMKATVQAWSLRVNGIERNDLDLAQIRNMVATGAMSPSDFIRKPGGEWMRAGEYHPLKSVFQQARQEALEGPRDPQRLRDPLAHPAAMAWLGALLGAVAGAGAWWLVAVIAGSEVLPMAVLVGILSGSVSAWMARGESLSSIGASAVATLGAMIVGRIAVFQTLSSGVMGDPSATKIDPLVFLSMSASGSSLAWWGIATLAAAAAGGVGLLLRKK